MGRLTLYADDRGRTVVHEDGFSWVAALWLPLWALQRRLYVLSMLSTGWIATYLTISTIEPAPTTTLAFVASQAIAGALASRYQRWILQSRGWLRVAQESTLEAA